MRYSRIFLIDDDEDDQELFLLALGQIDPAIECSVHPDGKAALQALDGSTDAPDLIVLDLNMPRMTGQQFLAALDPKESKQKKIPVIVLSTSSDPASAEEIKIARRREIHHQTQQLQGTKKHPSTNLRLTTCKNRVFWKEAEK